MKIAMVMAMDRNRLIGYQGGLPWHISADLKHFKKVTLSKPIIMGRKTWDSIGRPLPGRTNIVVTRNKQWSAQGCHAVTDLDTAFAVAQEHLGDATECAVIGGAMLCEQAMPKTDRLYLTVIDHAFVGDTWLESYHAHAQDWQRLECTEVAVGEGSDYALSFNVLERTKTF